MPGAGHWRLGFRKRAFFFVVPALFMIGILFSWVVAAVSAQMQALTKFTASIHQTNTLTLATQLSEKISTDVTGDGSMKVVMFFLIACYVACVADLVWLYQSDATTATKSTSSADSNVTASP